jgi:hypothetical protein
MIRRVEIDGRFRGAYCFHQQGDVSSGLIALIMEAVTTSEALVNFYETTQHNIAEDPNFVPSLLHTSLSPPHEVTSRTLNSCNSIDFRLGDCISLHLSSVSSFVITEKHIRELHAN